MPDAESSTRRECRLTFIMLAASVACTPCSLGAQDSDGSAGDARRSITAVRIDDGGIIELDGLLDEDIWRRAEPATGFRQAEPIEGAAATERTEVFVLYSATDLYIGALLHDSDPGGILAYQKQRDAGLGTDDRFMWILDTFLDGRTGYFFEINPAGLMGDGLLTGGVGVSKSWDGIWEARVARGAYGWSAEIRIPFRTLNFNPERDAWGINFQRTVRRKNEETRWSGHRRNQDLTRPVHAGRLADLRDLTQGLGLEATPYAVAGWRNTPTDEPGVDPTTFPTDVGFDLSYNVTPSLRASVTFNTDFAEVEVDQRQVNLTRFPLFFPERRDFFLEGSGVFSFAPRNGVNPYFSRNIGLVQGDPVPILYGARLGGQAGRYELGFVQVHTQSATPFDTLFLPAEDFTVARVRRTLLEQSTIGLIYTRRATAQGEGGNQLPDRHTVGADLDLFTSRFLGDRNFQFEAFFVWNSDSDADETSSWSDRTARGLRINYPNDLWRIHTSYRELPAGYAPAVGFTSRSGFRRLQPTVTFAPRPRDFLGVRQLEFQVQFEYLMDYDWRLETRSTDVRLLGLRFDSGDQLDFQLTQLFERLDAPFEIRDGIVVATGDYNTIEWRASTRFAGRRPVSGGVTVAGGQFWSGSRRRYDLDLTVKPYPGVQLSGTYERNEVDLANGAFTTNLFRVEGGWDVSPWASLTSNVQFDDVSDILGLFVRFRWIVRPGSDLFLVYTHNWREQVDDPLSRRRFETLSRGGSTKINYTVRF